MARVRHHITDPDYSQIKAIFCSDFLSKIVYGPMMIIVDEKMGQSNDNWFFDEELLRTFYIYHCAVFIQ